MIPKLKKITFDEFLDIDVGDTLLEFINGEIYAQAAPSIEHQRVVKNIATHFGNYLKGKDCEHFVSPLDIILQDESEKNKVQPDLMIICDKEGLNENNYIGIPTLLVEVLSHSTASRDYLIKMNLYMRFGVKEYWIVSPKNKTIEIFTLSNKVYEEPIIYSKDDTIESSTFYDLKIKLIDIF